MGTWAIDLDGVMWRGSDPVAGSARAVAELLGRGDRVVFCTNHALSPADKADRLRSMGVPECPVVTSGDAVLSRCRGARSVLVLGDCSLVEHLRSSGLPVLDAADAAESAPSPAPDGVDVVVVGAVETWSRVHAGRAADAVRAGAAFIATNDDPTFPTVDSDGASYLLPGTGAIVAAVSTAAGRPAEVMGKPHAPMAQLLTDRHGAIDVVVGDRPETDGALAARLGARFALVLSGVTAAADLPVEPRPWRTAEDLASLVEASVAGDRR